MTKTVDVIMREAGFAGNALPAISEANPATEADIRGQVEEYRMFMRNEGGFLVGEGAQDDSRVYESMTHVFP